MAAAPLAIPIILEALEAAVSGMLVSIGIISVGKQIVMTPKEQRKRTATDEVLEATKKTSTVFPAEPSSQIVKCPHSVIDQSKGVHVLMAQGDDDTEAKGESEAAEAHNASEFEELKKKLRRVMERPAVQDPELENLMDKNYRKGAQVGSGSTADAIRNEKATGQPTKGSWHTQKGEDMIRALERWLKNHPSSSAGDRAAAENVIEDLKDALGK